MGFIKTGRRPEGFGSVMVSTNVSNNSVVYTDGFTAALKKVATMKDDPEWVKGYEHGVRVREGLEEKPEWLVSSNDNQ